MTPTPEQVEQIAKKLLNTRSNVYSIAHQILGEAIGEDIFELLRRISKVFECEMCSEWLPVSDEDRSLKDICKDCVDAMNGDGEDE